MAKTRKRKPRKATQNGPVYMLETSDVQEMKRGMRKLMGLYDQRKALARKLRGLDVRIRDQRKYNADVLTVKGSEADGNRGALPADAEK